MIYSIVVVVVAAEAALLIVAMVLVVVVVVVVHSTTLCYGNVRTKSKNTPSQNRWGKTIRKEKRSRGGQATDHQPA